MPAPHRTAFRPSPPTRSLATSSRAIPQASRTRRRVHRVAMQMIYPQPDQLHPTIRSSKGLKRTCRCHGGRRQRPSHPRTQQRLPTISRQPRGNLARRVKSGADPSPPQKKLPGEGSRDITIVERVLVDCGCDAHGAGWVALDFGDGLPMLSAWRFRRWRRRPAGQVRQMPDRLRSSLTGSQCFVIRRRPAAR